MFVWKNLLRRPVRTSLTIAGVAFGVATLVALIAVARGVRAQFDTMFATGNAHLVVSKKGAPDPFLSYLPESIVDRLREIPSVASVYPFLWSIQQIPKQPFFFLYGTVPGSPVLEQVRVVAGHPISVTGKRKTICIGKATAETHGLTVGSTLELHGERFEVVGIYESAMPLMEGGGLMALRDVQRVSGLEGKLNMVLVHLRDFRPAALEASERAIEAAIPEAEATQPAALTQSFHEFQLMDEAATLLSLLAILLGGIGVMNTMLMSVFERTREFGILQACGWSRGMVLRLVLGESLAVCLFGGVLGIALGVFGLDFLLDVAHVAWLTAVYDVAILVQALVIAGAMGFVGAVYPALRAVRLSPVAALRHV